MPELTAEFVEREYNNRALVPEHPQHFARWTAAAEDARRTRRAHLDLRYGPGPRETLDIFPAEDARGTLMFIHGGYWRALDKRDHAWIAPAFVDAGLSVVVINYDLCPAVGIERIVAEQRQAVAWLAANGHRYDAPTQRIALAGHSAGGHAVAMLFATEWHQWNVSPTSIVGGVAVSGVFDLDPLRLFSYNADLRLDAASARELSPVHHRPRLGSPLLLAVGERESGEFHRQSDLLWQAWPEVRPPGAGGPLRVAGRDHFTSVDAVAERGHPLHVATCALFG